MTEKKKSKTENSPSVGLSEQRASMEELRKKMGEPPWPEFVKKLIAAIREMLEKDKNKK